jgi:hypothetical protein
MRKADISRSIREIADLLEMTYQRSLNFDDKALKRKLEAHAPIYEMAMGIFPLLLSDDERDLFRNAVYQFSGSLKISDLTKVFGLLTYFDVKYGLGRFKMDKWVA